MNRPLFHFGDIVSCQDSVELEQPMMVKALSPWRNSDVDSNGDRIYTYEVSGVHKKKGNICTVNLFQSQLAKEPTHDTNSNI